MFLTSIILNMSYHILCYSAKWGGWIPTRPGSREFTTHTWPIGGLDQFLAMASLCLILGATSCTSSPFLFPDPRTKLDLRLGGASVLSTPA